MLGTLPVRIQKWTKEKGRFLTSMPSLTSAFTFQCLEEMEVVCDDETKKGIEGEGMVNMSNVTGRTEIPCKRAMSPFWKHWTV